jgi:hypothetical protein
LHLDKQKIEKHESVSFDEETLFELSVRDFPLMS